MNYHQRVHARCGLALREIKIVKEASAQAALQTGLNLDQRHSHFL